jgi:hypothetical protein
MVMLILPDGALKLKHPWVPVVVEAPYAYLENSEKEVAVRYEKASPNSYWFAIREEIPENAALVIDPLFQQWGIDRSVRNGDFAAV